MRDLDRDDLTPWVNPHADRPNFTVEDYLAICRSGEAIYSFSEHCRLLGISRSLGYRCLALAQIPDADFEAILAEGRATGKLLSTTGVISDYRRRRGQTKFETESCPCCGYVLRERLR